jgi:hypothetical protein
MDFVEDISPFNKKTIKNIIFFIKEAGATSVDPSVSSEAYGIVVSGARR